ncbi:MAG: hypothetical protein AB7O28_10845 [Vicinamibacterales bacterium]
MALLTEAFSEFLTLAAPPRSASVLHHVLVTEAEPSDRTPALRAIDAALRVARSNGLRAAVCVVDLTPSSDRSWPDDAAARPDVWLQRRLRSADRLFHVGESVVIVASGWSHPAEAEQLVRRVQELPTPDGTPPPVGLAVYPTHGDDADTLLDRAEASAARARLRRRVSDRAAEEACA